MDGTGGAKNPAGRHLMICVVNPTKKGNALIVPMVSCHHYSDQSCVFVKGDHPFVDRRSVADYGYVKAVSSKVIEKQIDDGVYCLQNPLEGEVLFRFYLGFLNSDETAPWAFTEAKEAGLVAYLKREGRL